MKPEDVGTVLIGVVPVEVTVVVSKTVNVVVPTDVVHQRLLSSRVPRLTKEHSEC